MFGRNRARGDRRELRGMETRRDRSALAEDAGYGAVSVASVFAGTLVAFGATVLLLSLAASIASGAGLDVEVQGDWQEAGVAGGIILAGVLFVSYLFASYAAGRMARRHGLLHGVLVFVTSLVAVGVATIVARLLTDADADTILSNLRSVGVPTSGDEWRDVATVAGLGSLAAMLLGSLIGGGWGERWHSRLITRALDPGIGREATIRDEAETAHDDAVTRVEKTRVGGGVDLRDRDRGDDGVDDGVDHADEAPVTHRRGWIRH